MALVGSILFGVAQVLQMILDLAIILIIIQAVLSWVNPDPNNPIVRFLHESTRPMLTPIQRKIPPIGGRVDISPLVLLFGLYFLKYALVSALMHYAIVFNPSVVYAG